MESNVLNPYRQIIATLLLLGICLLWFATMPTDMQLQRWLYDAHTAQWLWDREEPVLRLVFYSGIKKLFIVFAIGLVCTLLLLRNSDRVREYRHGIVIVLCSMLLVPLLVGVLKSTTNVACPRALVDFGGSIPHVGLFEHYPIGERPESRQRCFPAGHASGGFALMSLYFLFRTGRNRRLGLLFGLAAGWITGGYKMVVGDHFLSHTVVTMLLAWLMINLIALVVQRADRHV